MDRYEISLWEDFPNTTSGGQPFLDERKLAVIGSDTMKSPARAIEPKLVNNINGTNTFTFKMYQNYIDEFTGEQYINPFLDLLINERKVKVLWKEKWYDLIIKDISEESATKAITYTCKDAFITELSRNGYNLEYSTDLQNNIGTAGELVNSVLENSGWEYDEENSTHLYQTVEDAVYETTFQGSYYLQVGYQIPGEEENEGFQLIDVGARIFIFYSSLIDINNTEPQRHKIRFLSFPYNQSITVDPDTRVIINEGNCIQTFYVYKLSGVIYISNSNTVGQNILFTVDTRNGVSTEYRGKYYINNQRTAYDKLFDRYVDVYNDSQNNNKLVYGYSSTEFSDPIMVVNLVANPTDFTNTDGWVGDNLMWGVYPKFKNQTVTTYSGTSYLRMGDSESSANIFNKGISSNKQYLYPSAGDVKKGDTGGFQIGDKYVFRFKAYENNKITEGQTTIDSPLDSQGNQTLVTENIQPFIGEYEIDNDNKYIPLGESYFDSESLTIDGYKAFLLTCTKTCTAEDLDKLGLFIEITNGSYYWFKEIQFFKYEIGEDNNGNPIMIQPGEVAAQSIAKTIYKYYNADYSSPSDSTKIATIPEELEFLYQGEEKQSRFIPKSTKCEKIATINESGSNRFNILQSIAEAFQCWIRFNVQHDETGAIEKDSETGLPIKKVAIVETVGEDLGWSFEYGIDLKTIKRTIASNDLTTKVLVLPNDNEYGKNGFCTIARSNLNYIKENFVLDFGYFTGQGLLDTQMVNRDLYDTTGNYLGYYYKLHNWNTEYDAISKFLPYKKTELTKQESQLEVLKAQQYATNEQLGNCWSDLMNLACVDNQADAQSYAETHSDHVKVQSLMNNIAQLKNKQSRFNSQVSNLENSIQQLKTYIDTNEATQKQLLDNIEELHINFFKKYARYIQEGTWQDSECIDDDKYYLDAVNVAYTSSRPRLQYDINVMRLQALDDFSSKVFDVGDLCYIVDREFFGYNKDDETTPYKLQIVISEITSNFDNPEKDTIKVQNFKTQFDDLFQRITATTQSLQYASGGYAKAAAAINPDKTLSFGLLQDTFDYNENWVLNANNQQVTWDSTGITVSDNSDAAMKVRIIAGGIFVSNDGGNTWKNAVRGDGISTDILTAGRINTSEIYLYDGGHPAFRWDSAGIDAYYFNNAGTTFDKFVRFDQFGIYGYKGTEDFRPATEEEIWYKEEGIPNDEVRFGLTWKGFFLHGESGISGLEIKSEEDSNGDSQIRFIMTSSTETKDPSDNQHYNMPVSLEISTDNDIVLKTKSYYNEVTRKYEDVDRIQIGRLKDGNKLDYGIWVRDKDGNSVFNVSADGVDTIGGWNLTQDSFYHSDIQNINTLGLYSRGKEATIQQQLDNYYILAGSKFGVTLDGRIYSSGGKIGGWIINDSNLSSAGTNNLIEIASDNTVSNKYVQLDSLETNFGLIDVTNSQNNKCKKYNINSYVNKDLYFSTKRSYDCTIYPIVVVVTRENEDGIQVLHSISNDSTTEIINQRIFIPESSVEGTTYLYLNYSSDEKLCTMNDPDSDEVSAQSLEDYTYVAIAPTNTIIANDTTTPYIRSKQYTAASYLYRWLYVDSERSGSIKEYPYSSWYPFVQFYNHTDQEYGPTTAYALESDNPFRQEPVYINPCEEIRIYYTCEDINAQLCIKQYQDYVLHKPYYGAQVPFSNNRYEYYFYLVDENDQPIDTTKLYYRSYRTNINQDPTLIKFIGSGLTELGTITDSTNEDTGYVKLDNIPEGTVTIKLQFTPDLEVDHEVGLYIKGTSSGGGGDEPGGGDDPSGGGDGNVPQEDYTIPNATYDKVDNTLIVFNLSKKYYNINEFTNNIKIINVDGSNYASYDIVKINQNNNENQDLRHKAVYISRTSSIAENYPLAFIITAQTATGEQVVQYFEDKTSILTDHVIMVPDNAYKLYINYTDSYSVYTLNENVTGSNITINSDGSIYCTSKNTNLWKIDKDGNAYFEMINATGGYIAGWHIDNDKIWNDNGTTLSASGQAIYNTNRYTIVTNSIAASNGNVGGWDMSPSGFFGRGIGLYNDGTIKLGGTTLTSIEKGLKISGSIQLGDSGNTGAVVAYGNVVSMLDGNMYSLPTVFKDFEINSCEGNGSTNGSRKQYLDWLHKNWGGTTPTEVRADGIKSVQVHTISVAPGKRSEGDSTSYYTETISGIGTVAYKYVSVETTHYGIEMDGSNSTPIKTSFPYGYTVNTTDVYNAGYTKGKQEVFLGTTWMYKVSSDFSVSKRTGTIFIKYKLGGPDFITREVSWEP